MKIFIFHYIEQLTYNYHSGGGLVVIAESVQAAKDLLSEDKNIIISEEEWKNVVELELVDNVEPQHWVMPDAGCC